MPKITALIHTCNDGLRLGRLLDSLRVCDQVIVIDHGSNDNTDKVAREHGAEFKKGIAGVDKGTYAVDANHDWILCIGANESVSEGLEAALFEWKSKDHDSEAGFNVGTRLEGPSGWAESGVETRLINRSRINWTGDLPPSTSTFEVIKGDILRFTKP